MLQFQLSCYSMVRRLYVGSTAVGVAKQHLSRMAVYKRLKKTEFVDAELSLRYCAPHGNLFDFVIVPL